MHPLVREANKFDIPALLDMLRAYRIATPLDFLRDVDDAEYITKLLIELMSGRGLILIAEEAEPIGMLMAIISPSQWELSKYLMTEMAYWMNPDARGSSGGYRLLSAYVEHGQALKDSGRISAFFISKMVNSPDLQYQKFGFTKLEEYWVI